MSGRWDAHIHLFERGFEGVIDAGVDEYETLRSSAGIDGALVVGYEGGELYRDNNAHIRELARTRAWIHPLAYLPAAEVPTPEQFDELRADGFVGVALYLGEPGAAVARWTRAHVDAPGLERSIVSINATPDALASTASWIARLTASQVLVSHLGLPGATASLEETRARLAPLAELRHLPHVGVKLSGLYAIDPVAPYAGARTAAQLVLEWFGPERVVWGSDFSPALGSGTPDEIAAFPAWLDDVLDPAERAAVAGGTLRQAIGRARRAPGSEG